MTDVEASGAGDVVARTAAADGSADDASAGEGSGALLMSVPVSTAGWIVGSVCSDAERSAEGAVVSLESNAPRAGPGYHRSASRNPSCSRTVRIAAFCSSSIPSVLATDDLLTPASALSSLAVAWWTSAKAAATRR